jgi:cytochrome oxidase Cu insertion factor (SCO1/SenC/PrrC family)
MTEPGENAPARLTGPWEKTKIRTRSRRSLFMIVALAIIGGFAFATVFAFGLSKLSAARSTNQAAYRPTGIPAGVSTSLATMMQLSPVPPVKAPGFTLTDQNGHHISLSSLHGKSVVLTFMDSHCTDICPLVSREFIDAWHDLGAARKNVVIIAVNVNQYHGRVADMTAYTRRMRLGSIPTWHFVTGPISTLRKVWKDYQIYVDAPSPNADVHHTSLIYFINPKGQERYVVAPMVDHTKNGMSYLPANQLTEWGRGIALVTRSITP